MEELSDTSIGKSVRVEEPVYPERVKSIRKGKDAGSLITMVYTFVSVTVPPPAVDPVAVMVTFWVPDTLVVPLITPVAALMESPGGKPVAEKEPLPECATV